MAKNLGPALLLLLLLTAIPAYAQIHHTELDLNGGISSQGVKTGAAVVRAFGDGNPHWRYYLEGASVAHAGPESDAFDTAYPYNRTFSLLDTYVEGAFHPGSHLAGVRLGRYRTPFGLYSESDQAYNGFLRPPLMRYYANFALSSEWLEAGADLYGGVPQLQLEASFSTPQEKNYSRQQRLDTVVRIQGFHGPFILGVDHLTSGPEKPYAFATGQMQFTGVDARWTQNGVEIRGEWVGGSPFSGVTTRAWYVDAIVHRPGLERVTGVARYEQLDYDAGPFSIHPRRSTVGARVLVTASVAGIVNVIHQSQPDQNAVDFGIRYTIRQ